ncbi:MAG TPA: ATP-binding protein [Gammaproteobacteria bacterium]|nr:ATP-binding protein [Gammaproteobacteria bacterium]
MSAVDALDTERPRSPRPSTEPATGDFAWRVLILLNLFRLAIGGLLLAVFYLVDAPRIVGENDSTLAWQALIGLLTIGCVELVLLQRRYPSTMLQTYLQFCTDLIGMTLLIHASGGISSGLGGVLIVSVGTLALLVPAERAFLLAAVTALVLLLEQAYAQFQGMTTSAQFAPAGILGAAIFVITAVVQLLRHRIVETEALAEQRGLDLRNLVELNDYIIQHLRESIVVVDHDDQIRLINESAGKHLSVRTNVRGEHVAAISTDLAERLRSWRDSALPGRPPPTFGAQDGTTLQPHFAPLGGDRRGGVVIFLEDTSLIEERVQQAKLAALGRLSASIAHEIRNPLGAMSHAGQLLAESPSIGKDDQRLTDIIRLNARRVSQIVESVLALSRRGQSRPERLQLTPWVEDFAREFVQTLELYEGAVSVVDGAPDIEVRMDPTHLHQILWNLCDNAVKYASAAAGAIAVEVTCGVLEQSGRPYLEVADRGPGIKPDKVEQIFEPFYTTQSGGTGLGLYISRELAERNGASLRYLARSGGGSAFRIVFADPNRWQPGEE